MKKILILPISVAAILVLGAVWLWGSPTFATPVMGTPAAFPTVLAIHAPTTVTVTISIPDSSLIANSVNLLRLGATGSQPTILGIMHDDGQNGDVASGDGIYTLQMPFNESTTGQFQLQVSVAFRGLLKRMTSSPINIVVTVDGTKPLPPDPGAAGMTTLAGIDSDGDGVRDDVQRYIALTYPQSAKTRAALTQLAKAVQSQFLNASTKSLVVADTLAWSYASECLDSVIASSDADVAGLSKSMEIDNALEAQILNTPDRIQGYYQANGQIGAMTYSRPRFPGLSARCAFDPSSLSN